jgi:predicted DNA-binding protein (MmcQ/YjbR family)
MDAEQTRAFLLKLPHVAETMQWGANLVYWAGDKAIGGKMFALLNLDEPTVVSKPAPVASFYVGPEQYSELLETEGVLPAPYFARIYWVALARWDVLSTKEVQTLLAQAHAGTLGKLPARTRESLALPKRQRDQLIAQRRLLLQSAVKKKPTISTKAIV